MSRVRVVGAGLSGLSTALTCALNGRPAIVLEAATGGIDTVRTMGSMGLAGPIAGYFVLSFGIKMSFAGYVILGSFLALILLRVPVAYALGLATLSGCSILPDISMPSFLGGGDSLDHLGVADEPIHDQPLRQALQT